MQNSENKVSIYESNVKTAKSFFGSFISFLISRVKSCLFFIACNFIYIILIFILFLSIDIILKLLGSLPYVGNTSYTIRQFYISPINQIRTHFEKQKYNNATRNLNNKVLSYDDALKLRSNIISSLKIHSVKGLVVTEGFDKYGTIKGTLKGIPEVKNYIDTKIIENLL